MDSYKPQKSTDVDKTGWYYWSSWAWRQGNAKYHIPEEIYDKLTGFCKESACGLKYYRSEKEAMDALNAVINPSPKATKFSDFSPMKWGDSTHIWYNLNKYEGYKSPYMLPLEIFSKIGGINDTHKQFDTKEAALLALKKAMAGVNARFKFVEVWFKADDVVSSGVVVNNIHWGWNEIIDIEVSLPTHTQKQEKCQVGQITKVTIETTDITVSGASYAEAEALLRKAPDKNKVEETTKLFMKVLLIHRDNMCRESKNTWENRLKLIASGQSAETLEGYLTLTVQSQNALRYFQSILWG